ncbi:MAG TPA: transposase [Meiothermus sp.]|nr:transposase [Meiothermus sp.]
MDSKKLPTAALARAKRVRLPGRIGRDHANRTHFYGLRLHAQVDDRGYLRRVLLRPAQEHDVAVAVRLLRGLKYGVVPGDRGYLSRGLKAEVARQGVDLIARHKRNMRPHSERERRLSTGLAGPLERLHLLRGHRIIESVFSSLDRLGLSERPYRKTQGLIFHIYAVLLGYGLLKRMEHDPAWRLLISYGRRLEIGWGRFSELGLGKIV